MVWLRLLLLSLVVVFPQIVLAAGFSLRFFGNGIDDIDRVKFRIDDPANSLPGPPADVGAEDFTLEFWMKASAADNTAPTVSCGSNIAWIFGNIVVDRDRFDQDRKFGLSIAGGQVVFGVSGDGTGDQTLCGSSNVLDGQWHHIAVQRRRADGWMWLYVDGTLEADVDGPDGDVSYPDDGFPLDRCGGPCLNSDPFLVIGAEKHDAGSSFPSYSGWIDELRLSDVLRYAGDFQPTMRQFYADANTAALYHFDEGAGNEVFDLSGANGRPSHGVRQFGGTPAGPIWSQDTPLNAPGQPELALAVSQLDKPVAMTHAGDGAGRLFITLQSGQIVIYDGGQLLPTPFLDITSLVSCCGERGLLGLAFHPNFASNGWFFVDYTNNAGDTVIARYSVSASDPNLADANSAQILLNVDQPFTNHNGGDLHFGPDGFLYIAMGDGGSGGDEHCNAQNLNSLLGKMLRIDVDGGSPYAIPADNPFGDEIWAYGLRNPWRFSFDRLNGDLFIGDVGQTSREEIDRQPNASTGGENYGWNRMEGTQCYTGGNNPDVNLNCPAGILPCGDIAYTSPILDYAHVNGNCSVTGGYRYRGQRAPDLFGSYFYGDFCSGTIWNARQDDNGGWSSNVLFNTAFRISAFGEAPNGELYILHRPSNGLGELWRITSASFDDVPTDHSAWKFVEAVFTAGIMDGCNASLFCPGDIVTRRDLAVHLVRAIYSSGFVPPTASGIFDDVETGDPSAAFIEQLFNDGISEGCTNNRFCPDDVVTNEQLAVLIERAVRGSGFTPPPAVGIFSDVPITHPLADFIEQFFNDAISQGCDTSPLRFCPDDAARKSLVATFVTRAFDLPKP